MLTTTMIALGMLRVPEGAQLWSAHPCRPFGREEKTIDYRHRRRKWGNYEDSGPSNRDHSLGTRARRAEKQDRWLDMAVCSFNAWMRDIDSRAEYVARQIRDAGWHISENKRRIDNMGELIRLSLVAQTETNALLVENTELQILQDSKIAELNELVTAKWTDPNGLYGRLSEKSRDAFLSAIGRANQRRLAWDV